MVKRAAGFRAGISPHHQNIRHSQFLHRRDLAFEPLPGFVRPRGGTNARRTRSLVNHKYKDQRVRRHAASQINSMLRRATARRAAASQARRFKLPAELGRKIGSYF